MSLRLQIEFSSIVFVTNHSISITVCIFGPPGTSVPTNKRDNHRVFVRSRKKLYLTLHNPKSKESRGSLLSTGFFLAIELNKRSGMLLLFTVAQTPLGNIGSSPIKTLDQPPQESFWATFFKKWQKALHKLTIYRNYDCLFWKRRGDFLRSNLT